MEKTSQIVKRMILINILRRTAMRETMGEIHCGQEPILDYLTSKGSSSQKDIAEFLHVTPASIALSTKRMEKSGLITKKPDEKNLRCNIIEITEKGKTMHEACVKQIDAIESRMFKDFSEDELKEMSGCLEKIIFNLTGETQEITHEVFSHYINRLKSIDMKNREIQRGKNKK